MALLPNVLERNIADIDNLSLMNPFLAVGWERCLNLHADYWVSKSKITLSPTNAKFQYMLASKRNLITFEKQEGTILFNSAAFYRKTLYIPLPKSTRTFSSSSPATLIHIVALCEDVIICSETRLEWRQIMYLKEASSCICYIREWVQRSGLHTYIQVKCTLLCERAYREIWQSPFHTFSD